MDERNTWLLAENAVVGSILVAPYDVIKEIRGLVNAADFQNTAAQAIFTAASLLVNHGKPCDYVQIQAEAAKMGIDISDNYIYDLMKCTATITSASESARVVHESAISRKFRDICAKAATGTIDPVETLKQLQEVSTDTQSVLHTPSETAQRVMDLIVDIQEGKRKIFYPTGLRTFDHFTGGLIVGGFITIAARPGTGKTTMALTIAENMAKSVGTVLYFSLEMTEEQIWMCRVSNLSGVNRSAISRGELVDEDWPKISEAMDELSKRPFYVRDKPSTLQDIEREARCMDNLKLIVVDHIGLVKHKESGSRYELMTSTAHDLKQLALNLRVPILGLCQLNRQSEQRENKRPTMADLRDSGAVEEDSDAVCLLFRPSAYLPEEEKPKPWEIQDIEVIIDKCREGIPGIATLNYCGANSRITDKAYGY